MAAEPDSSAAPPRIVVTGLGVVSSLGCTVAGFLDGLRRGASGIRPIQLPWPTGYPRDIAGVVTDFGPPRFRGDGDNVGAAGAERGRSRALTFAESAARAALEQAGLEREPARCAVVVGTTWGDALEVETGRAPAFDGLSSRLARALGVAGPDTVVTTSCAAGNHAISIAFDLLEAGLADRALAVGVDALCFLVFLGFSRLMLQDPAGCRPFDLERNGTVLAEGAGALLLERAGDARARGAEILAEVAGCGLSCDAAGAFESRAANVRSLEVAAAAALRRAAIGAREIDHVAAHGSATRLNDVKETRFLRRLLGERAPQVPVSAIKSMLGHAQGAASSLQAVACVLTLRHDVLFPTMNLRTPDPECDLDYVPGRSRPGRVTTILSNAFGMGGTNAIVIFRRWEEGR